MRILILHRIPHKLIRYADGIDHLAHEVTYLGTEEKLAGLPSGLPCTRIERPGAGDLATEVLAAISGRPKPDLVIALSEYDLLGAAQVRAALGVPGDRVQEVIPVRDKVVMKAAVARAGLRVPRFRALPEALSRGALWTGPTILKPLDGAASENVERFPTAAAAFHAVRHRGLAEGDEAAGYEIEEFVDGPIIHLDGLVVDGRAVAILASRYVGTCLAYAKGEPLGSVQIDTPPPLIVWALGCLRAVGIRTGLFHLEAIESPDGLVFLEVGARFGGGDVVDTFELATGVHLPSTLLRMLIDGERALPRVRTPDAGSRYGWFVWPGHHLLEERCRIRGEERFRTRELVVRWVQRPPDEPLNPKLSYSDTDVPLAGVVGGAPTDVLERFLGDLFTAVTVDAASAAEPCHA